MIVLALDTETSGLLESRLMKADRQPHVLQFCGILTDIDTGEVQDEFTTFVRPPRKELLSDKISKITGITWKDLEQAPEFKDVATRIFNMIAAAPIVVAHNLSFDQEVLDTEAKRLGTVIMWPKVCCSTEATVHLKGYRLTLSELHEYLTGTEFEKAHSADADVKALVRCLIEMRKKDFI